MGLADRIKKLSEEPYNNLTIIMGTPGSGKTTIAGTYPKPMLLMTVGNDGGAVVLQDVYKDSEIDITDYQSYITQTPPKGEPLTSVYSRLMTDLHELNNSNHGYKSIVIDAYSTVEEEFVQYVEKLKGKKISQDERGSVGAEMLKMRNVLVELSRKNIEVVLVCHTKTTESVDSATGEVSTRIIPKMTLNNGKALLEKASNVMYACAKPVRNEDGTLHTKWLAFIGSHPNMDTKIRTRGQKIDSGIYIDRASYEKIEKLKSGVEKLKAVEVVEQRANPFEDETETKTNTNKNNW